MQVSVETALFIVYQPQAIFRVRPVSRCTASMPGHAEAVLAVSFSPDGRHLASGSGDTTVRFWDLSTQLPEHTCQASKAIELIITCQEDLACCACCAGCQAVHAVRAAKSHTDFQSCPQTVHAVHALQE